MDIESHLLDDVRDGVPGARGILADYLEDKGRSAEAEVWRGDKEPKEFPKGWWWYCRITHPLDKDDIPRELFDLLADYMEQPFDLFNYRYYPTRLGALKALADANRRLTLDRAGVAVL